LHLFYDAVWLAAVVLFAPWWLARCAFDRNFARMVRERLAFHLPRRSARGSLLVHGVSVGEVKGAAPLVRALRERYPELEIVISSTTATGLELARKLYPSSAVVRFPLDVSACVARFLSRVSPRAVVLVELEVWPNFLRQCNRRGIPIAVVNGRITEESFRRYRRFRHALPQFDRISLFCVQMEEYAERFRALGGAPARVLVTGNMKADGLAVRGGAGLARDRAALAALAALAPGQLLVVAGSTHRSEERAVAQATLQALPQSRLVLVPRHPSRAGEVLQDLRSLGLEPELATQLRGRDARADPARPLVVDTIGELELWYALADLVFVGGSLIEHGGQNVLEPAALGRAVIHGPHVENFQQEAALLERARASRTVGDARELADVLRELSADPALRAQMGERGARAVAAQRGATRLTLEAFSACCLES
jgi:3-deoxy-D-manno-octulosonic-acid transferase